MLIRAKNEEVFGRFVKNIGGFGEFVDFFESHTKTTIRRTLITRGFKLEFLIEGDIKASQIEHMGLKEYLREQEAIVV